MIDGADKAEAGDGVAVDPAHDEDDEGLEDGDPPAHAVNPILVSGKKRQRTQL